MTAANKGKGKKIYARDGRLTATVLAWNPAPKPKAKVKPLGIEMAERSRTAAKKWLRLGLIGAEDYAKIEADLVRRVKEGLG